jgi:hypothetical protein
MSDDLEQMVLQVLASTEEDWTWYRLDRALSAMGMGGQVNVARLASLLSERGLVDVLAGESPAIPRYRITERGRMLVRTFGSVV